MSVLGECMLELSAPPLTSSQVNAGLSYGGDTLNTAVYFARLGGAVDYLTALGDDSVSGWMRSCWQSEGVGCDWVQRAENSAPGLYLIELDEYGERSFLYWREQSAARKLLQDADQIARLLANSTQGSQMFYLSGITLALMSTASQRKLFEFAKDFRRRGGLVAFDSNHRPKLWPDIETAKSAYSEMYSNTDIALATADDEQIVFGEASTGAIVARLVGKGVSEVVVKKGEEGCGLYVVSQAGAIFATEQIQEVPAPSVNVVDTTAAGDSFNAAYLMSRATGMEAKAAVSNGHKLASTVISHRGAIIDADAMPALGQFGF